MNRVQSFAEIYKEKKKGILAYLTLCLLLSMVTFGGEGRTLASVDVTEDAALAANTFGGSFGEVLAPVIGTGYFAGIDMSWIMVIMSVVSLVTTAGKSLGFKGFAKLSGYSFGIFENPVVSVLLLLWFGLPLLLKAINQTYALGLSLENLTKKWNGVLMTLIALSQLIANSAPTNVADAASGITQGSGMMVATGTALVSRGLNVLYCFVALVITLVVYYLTRYLFSLIDIIMVLPCTFVPALSGMMEFGKLIYVVLLYLFARYVPAVYVMIFALTIFVGALLFRVAYYASRYFNNIYAKPLFKKLFKGFDEEEPLIAKKLPSKVRRCAEEMGAELVIPAYVQKVLWENRFLNHWDRWWLVSTGEGQFLVKPVFGKRDCRKIPIANTEEKKVFIKQFLFYHEIFTIEGSEDCITHALRSVPKEFHVVFSKEYLHRYQEIKNLTGFVDFAEYKEILKEKKKQEQLEKQQAKEQEKLERKQAKEQEKLERKQAKEQEKLERKQEKLDGKHKKLSKLLPLKHGQQKRDGEGNDHGE